MELKNNIPAVHAKTRKEWRKWLEKNHRTEKSVWLIIYGKGSSVSSVKYTDAVEEALCFGWIDSKANKRDEESHYQFFSKRNPKSNWSKSNKERVEKLIAENVMTEAGLEMINLAKQNGTWSALDKVDMITIPPDLQEMFEKNQAALEHWNGFSRSSRRGILEWIMNAKRPETRKKRIEETVTLAEKNIKANHPAP